MVRVRRNINANRMPTEKKLRRTPIDIICQKIYHTIVKFSIQKNGRNMTNEAFFEIGYRGQSTCIPAV